MLKQHTHLLLIITILFTLSVSCGFQVTPQQSSVIETGTPSKSLSTLNPTKNPGTVSSSKPTKNPGTVSKAKPTGSPNAPAGNQGSDATQNMTFEIPAHPIDVILGRPTGNSITVSVLAYQDAEVFIEYGPAPQPYSYQTSQRTLGANQPVEIIVVGLKANTTYSYRVRYRSGSAGDFVATGAATFSTQRAADSSFTFSIQSDSHMDSNSNLLLYAQTLASECAVQPDFVIDLGDTFMTDKFKPYTAAQPQYLAQRYYMSLIGQAAPLFLVLGNHDGEGAPRGQVNDMSVWSAQLRTKYFPNPFPDGFYTGNSTPDKTVGALQDYYAWEWGDALFIVLDPYWFTPRENSTTTDLWNPTLGEVQYQWLKTTLEASRAKWKFVFIHQLIGGTDKNGRGGIEVANYYEWGGNNADGSYGFDEKRPGWGIPIHQLLIDNSVTAVFHGHDHLFVKQELDGIIYQEVPQPAVSGSGGTNSAAEYGYFSGDILGGSGYLRVSVSSVGVTVDFIRSALDKPDELAFSYTIN